MTLCKDSFQTDFLSRRGSVCVVQIRQVQLDFDWSAAALRADGRMLFAIY